MSSPRTVLVLGAAGRLGHAVTLAFADAGWRVLAQTRRATSALPAGAVRLDAPLDDVDRLAVAAAGAEVVVNAVNPAYTAWDRELLPLGRAGRDVAGRLGARLVQPGTVYGFGASMPARLVESTPERPSTAKGRLRVALEGELASRAARGALRASVVRAGDFYGAGRGSWLDLVVVKSLAAGRLVYPGPLDVPHAWAYLPDLARAVVAVASRPDAPAFERLHFPGHTLTGAALLATIGRAAEALGHRPPRGWRHGGLPWPLLRLAGIVAPMPRELARMSYLWRVPHALDGSALEAAIGPLRDTPPPEAIRASLVALGLDARRSPVAAAEGVAA